MKSLLVLGYAGSMSAYFELFLKHWYEIGGLYQGMFYILLASTVAGFAEVLHFNEISISNMKFKLIKWLCYLSGFLMGVGVEVGFELKIGIEAMVSMVIIIECGFIIATLDRVGLPIVPQVIKDAIALRWGSLNKSKDKENGDKGA